MLLLLGSAPAQAMPKADKDTLVYSWTSNCGPLSPHAYSPSQMYAQDLVYDSLLAYGEGGVILPALAERWEISPDGKTYTFHLRKGVVFSDGTPFTAEVAKQNWEAVLKNKDRHKWLELIAQLDRLDAPDPQTFVVTLKNPYYPALQEICLIRPIRFLAPAGFPDDGDTMKSIKAPIGTGPYKLVESVKGEYDLFEINEKYWGETPRVKRLLVKVIPDSNARSVALETGEIDFIYGTGGHGSGQIGLDAFQRFASMPAYATAVSKPTATRALALNSNRGATKDKAVRQAILHAVNKAALIKHIFYNVEVQAESLFSPSVPYCDLTLAPYAFDQQQAASLLDAAGWTLKGDYRARDGQVCEVDLCFTGNDALQKSISEAIQGDLKKVGIKVNLIGEEPDSIYARQKSGEFGLIFGETWGAPYDPHSFVSSMRTPSHADYQAQIGLPMKADIDKAINDVLLSVDEGKRRELYGYILRTLHEEAVYLPISYQTMIAVWPKDRIEGVAFGPTDSELPAQGIGKK
ncbi:nickel ABC transporter substrate-binding protein [Megalodesulfovibrio paquesii]